MIHQHSGPMLMGVNIVNSRAIRNGIFAIKPMSGINFLGGRRAVKGTVRDCLLYGNGKGLNLNGCKDVAILGGDIVASRDWNLVHSRNCLDTVFEGLHTYTFDAIEPPYKEWETAPRITKENKTGTFSDEQLAQIHEHGP